MTPDAPLMDQHIGDPQSWNLYSYVRNNPLSFVDPDGNSIELTCSAGAETGNDGKFDGTMLPWQLQRGSI